MRPSPTIFVIIASSVLLLGVRAQSSNEEGPVDFNIPDGDVDTIEGSGQPPPSAAVPAARPYEDDEDIIKGLEGSGDGQPSTSTVKPTRKVKKPKSSTTSSTSTSSTTTSSSTTTKTPTTTPTSVIRTSSTRSSFDVPKESSDTSDGHSHHAHDLAESTTIPSGSDADEALQQNRLSLIIICCVIIVLVLLAIILVTYLMCRRSNSSRRRDKNGKPNVAYHQAQPMPVITAKAHDL